MIADNLSSHKVAGIKEAIEAVGASIRYLPPYSPDLNPIEKFSPSSRRCSERPPSERSMPYGMRSVHCSIPFRLLNARTTSSLVGMY